MSHEPSKNKNTTRELLFGGGATLLILPLALFALVFSVIVVVAGGLMGMTDRESLPAWGIMIAVYGSAVLAILYLLVRIAQRSRFLLRRSADIRSEKHRTDSLMQNRTLRLEDDSSDSDEWLDDSPRYEEKRR